MQQCTRCFPSRIFDKMILERTCECKKKTSRSVIIMGEFCSRRVCEDKIWLLVGNLLTLEC